MDNLDDVLLCRILRHVPPYGSLRNASLVCTRWHRLARRVHQCSKEALVYRVSNSTVTWRCVKSRMALDPSPISIHSTPMCHESRAVYADGFCYVWCGTVGQSFYNHLFRYNIENKEWILITGDGVRPTPRRNASLLFYKAPPNAAGSQLAPGVNYLILHGGAIDLNLHLSMGRRQTVFNDTYFFNLETHRWSKSIGQMAPPQLLNYSESILGDKLVIFGGCDSNPIRSVTDHFWMLDLETQSWSPVAVDKHSPTPAARTYHTQWSKDPDCIFIIGGYMGTHFTEDCWCFSFLTHTWCKLAVNNMVLSPIWNRHLHCSLLGNWILLVGYINICHVCAHRVEGTTARKLGVDLASTSHPANANPSMFLKRTGRWCMCHEYVDAGRVLCCCSMPLLCHVPRHQNPHPRLFLLDVTQTATNQTVSWVDTPVSCSSPQGIADSWMVNTGHELVLSMHHLNTELPVMVGIAA